MFERAHSTIPCILQLFLCWVCDFSAMQTSSVLGEAISYKTVLSWYEKIRLICSHFNSKFPLVFASEHIDVLHEDIVLSHLPAEIDEAVFGKSLKDSKGTSRIRFLVFGLTERKGRKLHVQLIPDAKKTTLWPIIQAHVHNSCSIYHDGHKSYTRLHDLGYDHKVVFHNRMLVTDDGVHTNGIEGVWGRMKQKLAVMHGVKSEKRFRLFLSDFMYKANFFTDDHKSNWDIFLKHCAEFQADKYGATD